jgi:hypothetical protein
MIECSQVDTSIGIAMARIMVSLAAANDLELHSVDIEQAFTQADKLPEGVNGRYFINPPPGSPDAGNRDIVYEVLKPLYGNPSSPRALHKTIDAFFKSEGFDTIGFEESIWRIDNFAFQDTWEEKIRARVCGILGFQ